MTRTEQGKLCAVIARHPALPEAVFFRDCFTRFGKDGRASNRTEDGLVIARAVLYGQKVFIFDNTKPERESRIVLVWESMLLCGFPIDIICKMDFRTAYSDSDLSFQRLACEVLPVPVFMAIFLATLASVPWSYADDGDDMNEHDGH